jgi:tetratricopeptide (TPR) repeat protein
MDEVTLKTILAALEKEPTDTDKKAFLLEEEKKHPSDLSLRMKLGFLYDDLLKKDMDLYLGDSNPIFVKIDDELSFSRAVKDVGLALEKKDNLTAEMLVDEVLPAAEELLSLFLFDKSKPYFYFHEPFDQMLYFFYYGEKTGVAPADVPFDLGRLFYDKGYCLTLAEDYEAARPYFEKALQISPMSMALRLGLYETYLHPLEEEKARKCLIEDFQYVHNSSEVARLYRELAFLAEEKEDYVQAQFLQVLAISFCENKDDEMLSFTAIERLGDKATFPFERVNADQIHELLVQYDIPLGPNPDFMSYLHEGVRFLADDVHQYQTAVELAHALVSLSGHAPENEELLAHCLELERTAQS